MPSDLSLDLGSILASMLPWLIFAAAVYSVVAACLMVIARKTGTPGGLMAWIPIANIVLMCRIAGKSGWWALLVFIPLVNIVIGIAIWMGIARAHGKSPAMAFLLLVPLVGFIVPLLLASGDPTRPGAADTPASAQPAPAVRPSACPNCKSPVASEELFCGECGTQLMDQSAPAATSQQDGSSLSSEAAPAQTKRSLAPLAVSALVTLTIAGGGWWLSSRSGGGGGSAERIAPALPQRAAGAIREFPVDNNPVSPAQPTSIIRQSFMADASDSVQQVPESWLPPGLPNESLPELAEAVTSANYRTAPDAPSVPVHVLETAPGDDAVARRVADRVEEASGGMAETTGVEVTSPDGDVYEGYRVQTPETEVFALQHATQPIVIVIYAPEPAAFPVAERLAGNVSNGEGLQDYPIYAETFGALPAQPPAGLVLDERTTFLPEDLGLAPEQLVAELGSDVPPEVQEVVSWLQSLIPERITTARYRDPAGQSWDVLTGEYGGTLRALATWLALRTLGASDALTSIGSAVGDGLWTDTDEGPVMIMRAGSSLIGLKGPPNSPVQQIVALAESMQIFPGAASRSPQFTPGTTGTAPGAAAASGTSAGAPIDALRAAAAQLGWQPNVEVAQVGGRAFMALSTYKDPSSFDAGRLGDYWVGNRDAGIDDDNPVFWNRNLGIFDMGTEEDAALYLDGERRALEETGGDARAFQSVPLGIAGADDELTVPAAQRSLVRVGRYVLIALFNDLNDPAFNPNFDDPGYSDAQVAELRRRMSALMAGVRQEGMQALGGGARTNPAGDPPLRQPSETGGVEVEALASASASAAGGISDAIRATLVGARGPGCPGPTRRALPGRRSLRRSNRTS